MVECAHRAAWMEIDLTALRNNFRLVRDRVGAERRVMPVVKADAYGHGAVEVSRALAAEGAAMLAVATYDELCELRAAGIVLPVLVLGYVPVACHAGMIEQNGVFTVYDLAQARQIQAAAEKIGQRAVIHIKVDSGLHRLGFIPSPHAAEEIDEICRLPGLEAQGIFSHFAIADSADKTYTRWQHRQFADFLGLLQQRGLTFPLRHLANSASITDLPEYWYDAVRPGIILYGCYPSDQVQPLPGLRPVMQVKAAIVRLAEIPRGSYVSYGCIWQAERESLVATLPLGYADGVSRLLANNAFVLINGRRAPVVGKICMDQIIVDVTDLAAKTPLAVGMETVVLGEQQGERISAEEMAARAQTINYEVLCHFGARLPRRYI